ncbi:hypothetical protein N399_16760 [Bacillus licheniformis CG-B52]|nr:hypothetical protein N399_16760 [Bacillus licheniformis CG-B52]KUL10868.1 hypothetical protein LI17339_09345 [Bacillus licheniformis LMG 17339]
MKEQADSLSYKLSAFFVFWNVKDSAYIYKHCSKN